MASDHASDAMLRVVAMLILLAAVACGGDTISDSPDAAAERDDVLKAVGHSNAAYAHAFQTGDMTELRKASTGMALAYYEDSMKRMLVRNERLEAQLLEVEVLEIKFSSPNLAVVSTRERWRVSRTDARGQVLSTQTYLDDYEYELSRIEGLWLVSSLTFESD